MKIVIDIPESSLGLINDETTKIVYEAIRNGIVLPEGHGDWIRRLEDIIDNAPTVEISKIEHKAYNEGFKDGVEQGIKLSERPQGEWIEVGDNQPYSKDKLYGCSKCRFGGYLLSDTKNVNFCSNCGADMRI